MAPARAPRPAAGALPHPGQPALGPAAPGLHPHYLVRYWRFLGSSCATRTWSPRASSSSASGSRSMPGPATAGWCSGAGCTSATATRCAATRARCGSATSRVRPRQHRQLLPGRRDRRGDAGRGLGLHLRLRPLIDDLDRADQGPGHRKSPVRIGPDCWLGTKVDRAARYPVGGGACSGRTPWCAGASRTHASRSACRRRAVRDRRPTRKPDAADPAGRDALEDMARKARQRWCSEWKEPRTLSGGRSPRCGRSVVAVPRVRSSRRTPGRAVTASGPTVRPGWVVGQRRDPVAFLERPTERGQQVDGQRLCPRDGRS